MTTSSMLLVPLLVLGIAPAVAGQPAAFNVKTYVVTAGDAPRLVEKDAVLTLDDVAQRLIVRSKERPVDVPATAVRKVIFESSNRLRGGGWGAFGLVGMIVATRTISDYWCFLEVDAPEGIQQFLLEIPKDTSAVVIDKARALLGGRVTVPEFPERPERMRIEDLKARDTKHDFKRGKTRPLPEVRADRALIVVLSPVWSQNALQTKVHANDDVVTVTELGTYAFAHLEPGQYVLASQMRKGVNGFRMTLEAGQEYYFMQSLGLTLTRHSKELVTFLMQGAAHAEWQLKPGRTE